jgi:hypothetical protein
VNTTCTEEEASVELMTHCPYDDAWPLEFLILELDDVEGRQVPVGFYSAACCFHVEVAQHFIEEGGWDEVVQQMPAFAAHLEAVIAAAPTPRGRTCADAGPPFHYPTNGA